MLVNLKNVLYAKIFFLQKKKKLFYVLKDVQIFITAIIFLVDSIFCGLECKTEKGKQSPAQKEAEQAIIAAGGKYFLIRSMEEIRDAIEEVRGLR